MKNVLRLTPLFDAKSYYKSSTRTCEHNKKNKLFKIIPQDDLTPLPETILSAITFPITLPLDRTLYLSYFSRYSRDKKNDIRKRQLHNKKKFIIIPQDDELSLHFQRQYCPP